MTIEKLKIAQLAHFARRSDGLPTETPAALPSFEAGRVFFLGTCQRSLWVFKQDDSGGIAAALQAVPGIQFFSGAAAYEQLLSIACGLESQILGETNIFGQIKEAWDRFSKVAPRSELASVFRKLFEDTKDIRSQYLRNTGGACYGALVRQLLQKALRESAPGAQGPILILGAGEIAQTVAPWLAEQELWIINRDGARAEALRSQLVSEHGARAKVIEKESEAQAFALAAHLIVCIPFDAAGDPERIRMWNPERKDRANSRIIHLSGPRAQAGAWNSLSNFSCLDDLFALQENQSGFRAAKIAQARKACADRSKLRAFGSSLSIAHGWEYLAAFC